MNSIEKLLDIAGPPLARPAPAKRLSSVLGPWGERGQELSRLLGRKNGFHAFLSALLLFPLEESPSDRDLAGWNRNELWKSDYGDLMGPALFFAEDLFGGQFGIRNGEICSFEPETGEFEVLAPDLEGWAKQILLEHEVLTGTELARQWQEANGALPPGKRLAPKVPFVAGGEYEVKNLYAAEPVEAMRFRANLARQIKDLPEGARIQFKVTD
jgi:hypothetical protein